MSEYPLFLEYIHLAMSVTVAACVAANQHIRFCGNLVGLICVGDMYFIRNTDMVLHHLCAMTLVHYMNVPPTFMDQNVVIRHFLAAEISTIFLTIRNIFTPFLI